MYKEDVLAEELPVSIMKASTQIKGVYEALLEPYGIGFFSYQILRHLWKEDRMAIKEMTLALSLPVSQLNGAIAELEGKGFITRLVNPDDGRSRILCLTEKGRNTQQSAQRLGRQLLDFLRQDQALSTIDLHDLNRLSKRLAQVAEVM